MTPEHQKAARERCEKATAGEWIAQGEFILRSNGAGMVADIDDARPDTICRIRGFGARLPQDDNLAFIAHARTDLPAALDEIDRLQERYHEVRKALDTLMLAHIGVGLSGDYKILDAAMDEAKSVTPTRSLSAPHTAPDETHETETQTRTGTVDETFRDS